ncbi:MAG: chromosome segregation protein SMC [Stappia sp.]|uniref:chromosome segregation protein SMC n=1 Tax=Stappia sp. TaxID=1870903 RepID=UPI000C4D2FE6|nr:chromosome segregation protein SMC [Stappia sp.]MAA96908.1 chromosome segregation protein SMC [Stappia sp.]MBM19584.1 chromosome segregation protein SMC [Stappia sp.]MBM21216.1 chromosome segregation protein SMC [Stappia sp.]
MKFSKLRVLGFKSFVEPMEFVIGDGLTGVVGPNGCGKSNLVESLRWVMGENSYKNMRASGMDDVIFSGSLNRPARNTAEVTLFLDNSDRTAPAGFNDADTLEVTRRIERESGSNYKINARDVRARDVQLLFADASTGARSPALVRQGQIGELIAAKPTSRRQILEEAAGISGLHSRRHEAELRLRAAEQNLDRLEDVLVQIDGQVDSLRRQARQAGRFRNLSAEIRSAEASLYYLRWLDCRDRLSSAEEEFRAAEASMGEAAALQGEAARVQAIAAHKVPEMREASAKAGAALQRLVIARNELDGEERRVRERLEDLSRRLQQLHQDIAREESLLADNDGHLATLAEEEEELRAETLEEEERAAEAAVRVEEADAVVAGAEERVSALTQEQAGILARRRQLAEAFEAARARSAKLSRQHEAARADLARLEAEVEGAPDLEAGREALMLAEEVLARAEEDVLEAEERTASARARHEGARAPLGEAEAALSRLETEARTLAEVLGEGQSGDRPAVVEDMSASPGYETALGAALGEDLDAPLGGDAPMRWSNADDGGKPDDPSLPAGAEPLSAHVEAPGALARRLAQIGVVESGQGEVLARALAPGQRLVTRDGALWRWDGFRIDADAPTPAAQRLARKNRLAALDGEIALGAETLEARRAGFEELGEALRQAGDAEGAARQRVRDLRGQAETERQRVLRLERAHAEAEARLGSLRDALERLTGDLEDARMAAAEAGEAMREIEEDEGLARAIEEARAALSEARAAQSRERAAAEGIAREGEMRRRRVEAIARERAAWTQRAAGAREQVETLRDRMEAAEEERADLIEAPDDIEIRRRDLLSGISRAEAERQAADDALVAAETHQREADQAAQAALSALSQARERKIRAEERLGAATSRKAEIEALIDEALEVPVTALPGLAGLKEGAPLPDPDAIERRVERLKAERERLGGVNLRAEDELREIEDQRGTLTGERDDLIEAIKRLRGAISNINREARERLLNAFDIVNGHFQRLFTHLFGGGTAELQLVDAEDPLDAGLEIIARPPGKKPQTMTLLSGGEQALTAMALIFAVFLTNPAPICVLDEVDAPLDDANVERYCDLLDEMTRSTATRFVVITHNPITMARMNRLFGVTMAERGVSQLVSVDLETAERFLEVV